MSAKKAVGNKAGETGPPSFEEAMQRLDQIVLDMESGALNLEDMIARFEEGQKLLNLCTHKLDEVEKKVEILVKSGDNVDAQPFDADPDEDLEDADPDDEDDKDAPF